MQIGNFFMRLLLSSPLHGVLSRSTLLIHYTGWKSGKTYVTPVNYTQDGNAIRITSKRSRVWWRNLVHLPAITLTLRGRRVSGQAVVIQEPQAVVSAMAAFLKPAPQMAKYFQVRLLPDGNFYQEELEAAGRDSVVIEIRLEPEA